MSDGSFPPQNNELYGQCYRVYAYTVDTVNTFIFEGKECYFAHSWCTEHHVDLTSLETNYRGNDSEWEFWVEGVLSFFNELQPLVERSTINVHLTVL